MPNAAVAAIEYALQPDSDGMEFLRVWFEGSFDAIRREWPEAPETVFIGADPMHPASRELLGAEASDAAPPDQWTRTEDRMPTDDDADPYDMVVFLRTPEDKPKLVHVACLGSSVRVYKDSMWKRTGLTRPVESQTSEE